VEKITLILVGSIYFKSPEEVGDLDFLYPDEEIERLLPFLRSVENFLERRNLVLYADFFTRFGEINSLFSPPSVYLLYKKLEEGGFIRKRRMGEKMRKKIEGVLRKFGFSFRDVGDFLSLVQKYAEIEELETISAGLMYLPWPEISEKSLKNLQKFVEKYPEAVEVINKAATYLNLENFMKGREAYTYELRGNCENSG